MDALIGLVKDLLQSQPFLQIFVGGISFLLIAYMVIRARTDREALPPPAPLIPTIPEPFMQGPRELIDLIREQREFLRRIAEDCGHIRECVRITRDESKRQTEILERMAEDQRVEARVAAERHAHP